MVFGEQPSASKWAILGTNDAEFNSMIVHSSGGFTTFNDINTKNISSSTLSDNVMIQTGFDFIQGNGTNSATKAITYPQTFATIITVIIGQLGYTNGSDPTNITSLNTADAGNIAVIFAHSVTTSGFTAYYTMDSSATLASTFRKGFGWMAIGTKT